jgi:hypothetical protein
MFLPKLKLLISECESMNFKRKGKNANHLVTLADNRAVISSLEVLDIKPAGYRYLVTI